MHPDVAALLAVQEEDIEIHQLEEQLAALMPKLEAITRDQRRAAAALDEARQAVDAEERRRREVHDRLDQYRQLEERNQAQLNIVTTTREASAAMAQIEQVRRMIVDAQRELDAIGARISELRRVTAERERVLHDSEQAQQEAVASLDSDRARLQGEIDALRRRREEKAREVPGALLSRYERIRTHNRLHAIFPLRGGSCTNCDTVIPLQRRSAMMGSGRTEICEGCGVLLYAG